MPLPPSPAHPTDQSSDTVKIPLTFTFKVSVFSFSLQFVYSRISDMLKVTQEIVWPCNCVTHPGIMWRPEWFPILNPGIKFGEVRNSKNVTTAHRPCLREALLFSAQGSLELVQGPVHSVWPFKSNQAAAGTAFCPPV